MDGNGRCIDIEASLIVRRLLTVKPEVGPHQKRERGDLKQNPELGLGGRGDDIGEDALLLDDDLEHIGHHASGVPEGVLLADVVADQALVVGVVKCGAQVSRGEHLALACM